MATQRKRRPPKRCPACGCRHFFPRITDETILDRELVWACYACGREVGRPWVEPTTLALIEKGRAQDARRIVVIAAVGAAAHATVAVILGVLFS
jgi:hypothetical protein